MTKKVFFSSFFGVVLFAGAILVGVSFNLNNASMSDIALSNIKILAQNENGDSECPGGSCGFTWNDGNSCFACCPEGKNPKCTPNDGCSCS